MHINFDQLATGVDQLKTRSFTRAEKDEFLNMAIIDLLNERAKISEENQEIVDELSPVTVPINLSGTNFIYGLPSDYFRALRVSVVACGKPINCKFVQHDDLGNSLSNATTAPDVQWGNILYTRIGNNIQLYTGNVQVGNIDLIYIRYPAIVSIGGYNDINGNPKQVVQCDLPLDLHNEVVRRAVRIAHTSVANPQYYQVSNAEVVQNK